MSFENILKKLEKQVENTTAYILVDDLNHLVKGGPLSVSYTHLTLPTMEAV